MKKILLTALAFVATLTASAQTPTNYVAGLTPTIINSASTPSDEALAFLTDGDYGLSYGEGVKSAAFGNTNPTIFYYDLGESKTLGRIAISWTGAHANAYKIYAVETAPADVAAAEALTDPIVDVTGVSVPAGQNKIVAHDVTGTGRYIVFVATGFDYGCTMHEFAVYENYSQIFTSFEPTSGDYIYNAAQNVPLALTDQIGLPYSGDVTSISFANAGYGYATSTSGPDFTFGADFPRNIDDLRVTAGEKTVTKGFGFLNSVPDPSDVPAIDADASYIIFSAEKNEKHDVWNTYDGDNTSTFGDFSIAGKTATRVKTMKYIAYKNNTLSSATDMTGLVLDIFVTEDHAKENCHLKAEGVCNIDFPANLTKGWNHIVFSTLTNANYDGLNTNTTLFIRIDDAVTENVVIYNVYYTKVSDGVTLSAVADATSLAVGGTTTITPTVTASGSDVTTSATITYTSSNPSVLTVTDAGSVTAVSGGTAKVTVSATYNEITKTEDIDFTVLLPVPTAPTESWENVLVVFSNEYHQGEVISITNPTYGKNGSPFETNSINVYTSIDYPAQVSDHKVVHVVGAGVNGWTMKPTSSGLDGQANMLNYYKVHFAVWPTHATKGEVFADNKYTASKTSFSGLIPGQWNYITVNVDARTSGFGDKDFIVIYFMEADGTMETEFYLDHFYLSKLGADEAVTIVNGNTANVFGTLTSANVGTVVSEGGSAAVIDLTATTINSAVTLPTPANQNAVVVVNGDGTGDGRTPDSNGANVSASNIVVYGTSTSDGVNKFYRAKDDVVITLVDDNASQPTYNFVIDAQQDGFTYERTVDAGKWVSYNSPAPVTIPAGVTVYKATDATTTTVTFTKQDNQNLGANVPVILHNNTDDAVVIRSDIAKTDLNLTANGGGNAVNSTAITEFGTSRPIVTDGSQYALSNGVLHPFNGATIGAFRVYYTGLTAATARALFDDGETTAIGHIDANGNITVEDGAYYDLAGRRVENPTKGIFIHNGKKVVIR